MASSRFINTMVLVLTRLAGSLFSIVVLMILSRKLDLGEYGKYQQLWLLYNTLLPFFLMGLPSSISYIIPQLEKEHKQKSFFFQTVFILFCFGCIVSLIFFIGTHNVLSIFPSSVDKNLASSFLFIPIFSIPFLASDLYFISIGKVRAAGIINLSSELVNALALIIPVYFYHDIGLSIKLYGLFSFVKMIVLFFIVKKDYEIRTFRFDKELLKRQFVYSLPLALASLASILNMQLDNWFISLNFSAETFAVYFNGARELPFISMIAGSITAVVVPEFNRLYLKRDFKQIVDIWLSATKKAAFVFIPLMFLFLLFSRYIIGILFSSKYEASVVVFNVYLLLLPLRVTVYGAILSAAGKSKTILRSSIQMIIINLGLCFLLIKPLGIWAPLISVIVSTYYMAMIQLYYTSKLLSISVSKIFPWKFIGILIIVSLIPYVILLYLKPFIPSIILFIGVTLIIFGAAYYICNFILKRLFKLAMFDSEISYYVNVFQKVLKK